MIKCLTITEYQLFKLAISNLQVSAQYVFKSLKIFQRQHFQSGQGWGEGLRGFLVNKIRHVFTF